MLETLIFALLPVVLIVLGYVIGNRIEIQHFRSLEERERRLTGRVILNVDEEIGVPPGPTRLVTGSTVVSADYFKRFLAKLIQLVGGRIVTYETLLDRARREALVRMREASADAPLIINVRVDTAPLGGAIHAVEVLAYGTAVESAS